MHYGSVKEGAKKKTTIIIVMDVNCLYEAFFTEDLVYYSVALLKCFITQSI